MTPGIRLYLSRLGLLPERLRPDRATLTLVHRCHALAVAYENLDVQLGRTVTTDPDACLAKLAGGRGGWCYEMNGSLGAALVALGFDVTRMAGGVHRASMGDAMLGNHLVLRVVLEGEPFVCDVGFGDGLVEPIPLRESTYRQGFLTFRLERLDERYWRFHNDPGGAAPSFDFADQAADEALLASQCHLLQTAPQSVFVQNAVVQRHRPDAHLSLVGRVLRRRSASGVEERRIDGAEEYVEALATEMGLDLPAAAGLWPRIVARHEELFGTNA